MISPTQPYPQSQALCLLHPLWGGRVIMIKFCDVMMVLVIVVVVIEMMSICWYLRAVMVAPHEITLRSTFPLVRVNRHTWSMSKVKMMVLEIFHRWSRFCAILFKRDEPRHLPWQKSSDGIISKNVFFHLLTIRRSAKAVFCDRRHLLKFSLQQDLWTKIITNIVFQSFRLCSRTALQVLSTEYTLWLLWPKNWKGEDFVSASVDPCTPALPMLTSTTTQATETKHDLWISKKYFSSGTDFTQQGFNPKKYFICWNCCWHLRTHWLCENHCRPQQRCCVVYPLTTDPSEGLVLLFARDTLHCFELLN